jgi:hypothetical protein
LNLLINCVLEEAAVSMADLKDNTETQTRLDASEPSTKLKAKVEAQDSC